MAKCNVFFFGATGLLSWTPEEDCILSGVTYFAITAAISSMVLSENPTLVTTDLIGATHMSAGIIAGAAGFDTASVVQPLLYPVRKGQTIYFSASDPCIIYLYYSAEIIAT
jgi:hypothetical protein